MMMWNTAGPWWVMALVMGGILTGLWALVALAVVALARGGAARPVAPPSENGTGDRR